ncbi:MarR family transcriptional regulator [Nocardia sp. MH4]|uniref:MarR family winged helix-turn-helix transcriptional regulator n=1 Tax=unclassified Nocardia TaxID=2637762 RepID=UPI001C4F5AD4|nr:helix-turn-helix domain-containing protein [Nocardia sp. MH4]MBW0275633.1 MarR family transcriptional regulator [Nocardia sp. MH4]
MDGVELFLLGRTLMKIGEEALPTAGLGGGHRPVLVVTSDIVAHPDSTVGEIARRTGLPQSAVSTAVARLEEAGSITTATDPRDRRRTVIRPAERISARVAQIRASTIDAAVAAALPTADPAATAEVLQALDVLARHLRPRGTEPR